ncbi:ABC transporter permease [Neorhizobium sp. NCHU2750]|uniref:ABC transporter permease n=1 Tax=Neorhizobium sp. NCHU2750 TaxID=1825976 RepID=UPI000E751CE0|nr:peptide/nickel ABC transporter permease [Neorhizobium sp. NCHU2750]
MLKSLSIKRCLEILFSAFVVIFLLASIFANWVAPFPETEIVGSNWSGAFWQDTSENAAFLLGTDQLGRDVFSRILFGARNTIVISLVTTVIGFVIGAGLGFAAAIERGWFDQIISRIVDLLMAIPTLILALMVLAIMGTSLPVLILVVAVIEATRVFRLSRLVAMNVASLEYFESARLRGEGIAWLIRKEIMPNVRVPLITEFGVRFCFTFLFIASLSFLGLGIQPPAADLGGMVRDNASAISYGVLAPLFPALAIAILIVAINIWLDRFIKILGK